MEYKLPYKSIMQPEAIEVRVSRLEEEPAGFWRLRDAVVGVFDRQRL